MGRTPARETGRSRVLGLVGHTSSGKTQLAEILLHRAGVVRQPGRVDAGTTLLDHEDGERARRASALPTWAWLPWQEGVLHLVDTPGIDHAPYVSRLALAGADAAALVLSGPDGVERGAEEALTEARRSGRPLLAVINKVDRAADLDAIVGRLEALSGRRAVLLQRLFVERGRLVGLVDLLHGRMHRYDPDGSGASSVEPVPLHLVDAVHAAREVLLEAVAVTDDQLLETYLDALDLTAEQVLEGLERAVAAASILPVLLTSATQHVGADALLDAIMRLTPPPDRWAPPAEVEGTPKVVAQWIGTRIDEEGQPVSMLRVWSGRLDENARLVNGRTGAAARVRKLYQVRGPRRAKAHHTSAGDVVATWDPLPGVPGDAFTDGPLLAMEPPHMVPEMTWTCLAAREPRSDDRLRQALGLWHLVDPSVSMEERVEEGRWLLGAASEEQLAAVIGALRSRFGIEVTLSPMPVAYVERPLGPTTGSHGRCAGPRDGRTAELANVWLDATPCDLQADVTLQTEVEEDDLPARFLPALQQGVLHALRHGPLAGAPVKGVTFRCTEASYDIFESTDEHFVAAGEMAARDALQRAGTELWEPWSEVHLFVPNALVGVVLSDLGTHRGRVLGLQVEDEETSILSHCPDRELGSLHARLRSLTHGRAWFVRRASHYDRLPASLIPEVLAHADGTPTPRRTTSG